VQLLDLLALLPDFRLPVWWDKLRAEVPGPVGQIGIVAV
jgi:hypothetical protein